MFVILITGMPALAQILSSSKKCTLQFVQITDPLAKFSSSSCPALGNEQMAKYNYISYLCILKSILLLTWLKDYCMPTSDGKQQKLKENNINMHKHKYKEFFIWMFTHYTFFILQEHISSFPKLWNQSVYKNRRGEW